MLWALALTALFGSHAVNGANSGIQLNASLSAADGIEGYVTVYDGKISVYLNTDGFEPLDHDLPSGCLSSLKYHVHMYWNHDDDDARIATGCNATYTGGHYDPWGACGGATGNMACSGKGGCLHEGESYSCDYSDDPLSCELGDWSGKYGKLSDDDADGIFMGEFESFGELSGEALEGYSIVFHCGDTPDAERAFCAPFRDTGMYDDGDSDTDQMQESGLSLRADFRHAFGAKSRQNAYLEMTSMGDYSIMVDEGILSTGGSVCVDDEFEFVLYDHMWDEMYNSLAEDDSENVCTDILGGGDLPVYDPTCACYDGTRDTSCDTCVMGKQCNDTMYDYEEDYCSAGITAGICAPYDFNSKYGAFILSEDGAIDKSGFDRYMGDLGSIDGMTVGVRCKFAHNIIACGGLMSSGKAMAKAMFDVDNNGIDGYVAIIDGQVDVNLDLSSVDTGDLPTVDCLNDGLKAHLHVKWEHDDDSDMIGEAACHGDYTGGHYDPWYGCGGATDNELCAGKGGCVHDGDTYECSESNFASNPFSCEVGDWSGKYGTYTISSNEVMRTDSHFLEIDANDANSMSVVFHCANNGKRAFCAPFDVYGVDGNGAPPTYNQEDSDIRNLMAEFTSGYVKLSSTGEYWVMFTDLDGSSCSDDEVGYAIYNDDGCSSIYDPTYSCMEPSAYDSEICDNEVPCDANATLFEYHCDWNYDPHGCSPSDLSGKYGAIPRDSALVSGYQNGFDDMMAPFGQISDKYVGIYCNGMDARQTTLECVPFTESEYTTTELLPVTTGDDDDDDSSAMVQGVSLVVMVFSIIFAGYL